MTAYEIISAKRDRQTLSDDEIAFMINGFTAGRIPDYQFAALLMAIFLNGMTPVETKSLTEHMLYSGIVADLSTVPGIKVDKHSTGGVGDKVSIPLAAIVAAAGVPVPMISGRGLGHTGGTLDKLQSIPGFRIDYSIDEYKKKVALTGACLIGQTASIAPADKKIYALRDVTATVQSIPLITASIMSKKLAEGIDALVLDVKTGRGAFMQKIDDSRDLAKNLIAVGERFGKPTIAYITNMDQPLGRMIGNWLEIRESIDCLQDKGPADLMQVTHQLCGAMIYLGQKAVSIEAGIEISKLMVHSGKAWQKFIDIVRSQEGDSHVLEHPETYPRAKFQSELKADDSGYLSRLDALEFGLASVQLGAGRMQAADPVNPKAGIELHYKIGAKVEQGQVLATLFSDDEEALNRALDRLSKAVGYAASPLAAPPLLIEMLDKNSL